MNKTVTSREILLDTAIRIAYHEGLSQINIRRVATECGVSIGTVYNYFPSKSDLIVAIIEDFWKSVFHENGECMSNSKDFVDFFGELYHKLYTNLKSFQANLLQQIASLSEIDKRKGRQSESEYLKHLKMGMMVALEQDARIPVSVWTKVLTRDAFITFIFSNMMTMLKRNEPNCEFLKEIIIKLLYV